MDNYEEVTQGIDDQVRSRLSSQVAASLNHWAREYDIFLRRVASDRFIAIMSHQVLSAVEKNKFVILDQIREETGKEKVPITLSVGIGTGDTSLSELGRLAQSSLDLALGRGGDQVAIKQGNGKCVFMEENRMRWRRELVCARV